MLQCFEVCTEVWFNFTWNPYQHVYIHVQIHMNTGVMQMCPYDEWEIWRPKPSDFPWRPHLRCFDRDDGKMGTDGFLQASLMGFIVLPV